MIDKIRNKFGTISTLINIDIGKNYNLEKFKDRNLGSPETGPLIGLKLFLTKCRNQ